MSKFNHWNINEDHLSEVLRVKKLSDKEVDIEKPHKVAISTNTTMTQPRLSIADWYNHIRKELQLNLDINK